MRTPLDGEALASLGFTPYFHHQWLTFIDEHPDLGAEVGRVVSVRRGDYLIADGTEARRAVLAGRLAGDSNATYPCIGDFVLVDWGDAAGPGRVEHVLERTSLFQRKRPSLSSRPQPIAANIDRAIVVCALSSADADPDVARRGVNVRRIERYLCAIAQAGVVPLVVVNKVDLSADAPAAIEALRAELRGVDVLAVSARSGEGMALLEKRLASGTTSVLVGASGVGKSSLTNALLGRERQRAESVREADGRGRHTTTGRELFALPWGGLIIDTPGMRELGLWAEGDGELPVAELVDAFARDCRFRDCRHEAEPGCAVLAALERGDLSAARLDHARKLERELIWQRAREDAALRSREKKKRRAFSRQVRERHRANGKK
jgi:ribosome biogenesis GTPase